MSSSRLHEAAVLFLAGQDMRSDLIEYTLTNVPAGIVELLSKAWLRSNPDWGLAFASAETGDPPPVRLVSDPQLISGLSRKARKRLEVARAVGVPPSIYEEVANWESIDTMGGARDPRSQRPGKPTINLLGEKARKWRREL